MKKILLPSELTDFSLNINPEPQDTICTENTEMSALTVLTVKCYPKWPVITELILKLFKLLELP